MSSPNTSKTVCVGSTSGWASSSKRSKVCQPFALAYSSARTCQAHTATASGIPASTVNKSNQGFVGSLRAALPVVPVKCHRHV